MTNLEYLPWQGTTAGFGGLQAAMLAAIVLRRGAVMEALGADSEGRVQEDNFSLLATGPSSLILDTASPFLNLPVCWWQNHHLVPEGRTVEEKGEGAAQPLPSLALSF